MFLSFEEVGSTMTTARSILLEGKLSRFAVWAKRQTAGRGRQGRSWLSPEGGMYLSLIRPVVAPPPLYGIVAALEVAQFFRDRGAPLSLKWPNDLIVRKEGDFKLGGILAELILEDLPRPHAIIGIGLNVRTPVRLPLPAAEGTEARNEVESASPTCFAGVLALKEDAHRSGLSNPAALPPLSLAEWLSLDFEPETLARQLTERCEVAYERLERATEAVGSDKTPIVSRDLLGEIKQRWRLMSLTLGQDVRLFLPSGDILEGRAEDIGDDFSLLLRKDGHLIAIRVGDCLHLRTTDKIVPS